MKRALILLSTCTLMGCGTGRIKNTQQVNPTEAIVFGKLTVITNKPVKRKSLVFLFNETFSGKNHIKPDDSGYFYMKLPLRKNNMVRIGYRQNTNHIVNIVRGYLSITPTSHDTIYYAGDITLDLCGIKHTASGAATGGATGSAVGGAVGGAAGGAVGGIIGAIADNKKEQQKPAVTIAETTTTINYFRNKFPKNKRPLTTRLAIVNPLATPPTKKDDHIRSEDIDRSYD